MKAQSGLLHGLVFILIMVWNSDCSAQLPRKKDSFFPVFIMNGGEDKTTPATNCIELYNILTSKQASVEMYIYAKGGHGFDSGVERGFGIATWRDSFIAWLKDTGFITEK